MASLTISITLSDEVQSAILTASRYQAEITTPAGKIDNPISAEDHIKNAFAQVAERAVRQARSQLPVTGITIE